MEFFALSVQQKRISDRIEKNIPAFLSHGKYVMGPKIKELEARLAAFAGVKHAIGVIRH